jgi:hypothetical protein
MRDCEAGAPETGTAAVGTSLLIRLDAMLEFCGAGFCGAAFAGWIITPARSSEHVKAIFVSVIFMPGSLS